MSKINIEVVKELNALKQCGVTVSKAAMTAAKTGDISEYDNMGISDLADLLIMLHG